MNISRMAKDKGFEEVFVPAVNAAEAAIVDMRVFGFNNLNDLILHLEGRKIIESQPKS